MTISKFDKPTLRSLRLEIDAALAAVAARHGIELKLGNIKFNDADFHAPVNAKVLNPATGVVPTAEREFHMHAPLFGLERDDYRREVTIEGERFRIVAVKTRAPRRPIVLERVSGGSGVVCSPEYVLRALGRKAA